LRTPPLPRSVFPPLLLVVVCSLASCSVPLGPGYTVLNQELELKYEAAAVPHLSIRCSYLLLNSGNQPLNNLRIVLPPAEAFHRSATQAEFNGQAVELESTSASPTDRGDTVELHWTEPWTQKQKRTLVFTYTLSTGFHLGSSLAAGTDTFFAFPDSWDPELLAPRHFFGKGGVAPKKWNLSVRVPSGFLVHASGTAGKRPSGTGAMPFASSNA
jgi:hypothetical protein